MRIEAVEIYAADLKMHEPFVIATMTVDVAKSVFVRIRTDSGIDGWGEAQPYWRIVGETRETALAVSETFARAIVGRDPLDLESRLDDLRACVAGNRTALSAFDMALHDAAARVAELPLYAYLGGARRAFATDRTVGVAAPKKMADDAAAFRARGFPAIKMKIGVDPKTDVLRVRAVREAIGDGVPLRVDANQGYDVPDAHYVLRATAPFDLQYCEQPVPAWDVPGLATVRRRSQTPIMADEAVFDRRDAYRVAKAGAADYVNVKLSKAGGIREAAAVETVASAAGLGVGMGCMTETRLGLTAAAHLVCARRAFRFVDLDGADFLAEDPIEGGLTIDDQGGVALTDAVGLGVDVDAAFLKRCPKKTVRA
jgi:L-Ala-D/L-Glu epimerase